MLELAQAGLPGQRFFLLARQELPRTLRQAQAHPWPVPVVAILVGLMVHPSSTYYSPAYYSMASY
jgi:hypothetical protein